MKLKYKSKLRLKEYMKASEKNAKLGLQDCLDDLVRTSSQNAPHDKGILEKSWAKQVKGLKGTVTYSVKKRSRKGNFNYALKMHEGGYALGKKSKAKTGGTGMSGKTYSVGAGYLGRVLKGEEATYIEHIEKMIHKFK